MVEIKLGRPRQHLWFWCWNAFVVVSLALLACGRSQNGSQNQPGKVPEGPQKKITLALFGAPWCAECKQDLPLIQQEYDRLSEEEKAEIRIRLFVTTSGNPAVPPTQQVADQYRAVLGLSMEAGPDEWRWKSFREWVGGTLALPGAAVLDADGTVLKSFRAGSTTFIPSEIVGFAAAARK
jgi:thiol-disulfide isomerase/thioredoxin